MSYFNNDLGQGTIEYLVIIAIVVVIALIVVGLFTGIFSSPSQQIVDSSSKTGEVAVGGISIVESVIDLEGDSLIKFTNNSSDSVNLTKISVGSVDNNYSSSDGYVAGLSSKTFSLSGLSSSCPCVSGQKSVKCEFRIEYLAVTGITKTELRTINVQCVNDSKPADEGEIIDPIVPVLELGTLANPWIINDCLELQDMNNHLDGNYILGNDIDCGEETSLGGSLYNGGLGFEPIGNGVGVDTGEGTCDGELYLGCGTDEATCESETCMIPATCDPDCGMWANEEQCIQNCGGVYSGGYATWIPTLDYISFNGSLDGNGHVVSNLNINRPSINYIGLFGITSQNVEIKDIGLTNLAITGQYPVGSLVGKNYGDVTDSYASGEVNGYGHVGGLIGDNYGSLTNAYFEGSIYGRDPVEGDSYYELYAGGLIGVNNGSLTNSYFTGDVSGYEFASGLIAWNTSNLSNSFSTGTVTSRAGFSAGLVVYNQSVLDNCYFDTTLSGQYECVNSIFSTEYGTCYSTDNSPSSYYGLSGIPFSNLNWSEANWSADNDYPILSWQ